MTGHVLRRGGPTCWTSQGLSGGGLVTPPAARLHVLSVWFPGGGDPGSPTAGPVTVSVPETKTAPTFTATDASTTYTAPP